jgi:hypothetical protein
VADLEDWLEGEEEGVWEGCWVCVGRCVGGDIAFVEVEGREVGRIDGVERGEVFVGAGEEECVFFYEGLEALEWSSVCM